MTQGKLSENINGLSQKLFLWGHFSISNFIAKYYKISRKRPKKIKIYPKILLYFYSTSTLLLLYSGVEYFYSTPKLLE